MYVWGRFLKKHCFESLKVLWFWHFIPHFFWQVPTTGNHVLCFVCSLFSPSLCHCQVPGYHDDDRSASEWCPERYMRRCRRRFSSLQGHAGSRSTSFHNYKTRIGAQHQVTCALVAVNEPAMAGRSLQLLASGRGRLSELSFSYQMSEHNHLRLRSANVLVEGWKSVGECIT